MGNTFIVVPAESLQSQSLLTVKGLLTPMAALLVLVLSQWLMEMRFMPSVLRMAEIPARVIRVTVKEWRALFI
jgi:hypothetical protein